MSIQELGKPFSIANQNDISDARLDAKTFMVDTADNIFNYPQIPGQPFIPRDTGHGFTKNSPCFLSVDGDVIIPFGVRKHAHAQNTDADGGLMIDQYLGNIGNVDVYLGNTYSIGDFVAEVSGTGAGVNSGSTYIELVAGTSSGGYANIRRRGVPLDFAKPSSFMTRFEYEDTINNYLFRVGLMSERVDAANDPTTKSYGIEGCNGQSNFQTWSCNGSARSTTPTSYAVDSADNTWMAEHDPSETKIVFTKNVSFGANQVTKTSDIPTSGSSVTSNFFSAGIKSTTASESKRIFYRGIVIVANIGHSNWKWYM